MRLQFIKKTRRGELARSRKQHRAWKFGMQGNGAIAQAVKEHKGQVVLLLLEKTGFLPKHTHAPFHCRRYSRTVVP